MLTRSLVDNDCRWRCLLLRYRWLAARDRAVARHRAVSRGSRVVATRAQGYRHAMSSSCIGYTRTIVYSCEINYIPNIYERKFILKFHSIVDSSFLIRRRLITRAPSPVRPHVHCFLSCNCRLASVTTPGCGMGWPKCLRVAKAASSLLGQNQPALLL